VLGVNMSYEFIDKIKQRNNKLLNNPIEFNRNVLESLFDGNDYDWEDKARRLQIRRWKKIQSRVNS
jgi:hypothetical protein